MFNGRIRVRPDAQKTDAKQTNKALLLSDEAQVNTKPQLEIFANDVRCTHGATVGQLSQDALFYLRTRGIGLDDARSLLVRAFAADVTSRIAPRARPRRTRSPARCQAASLAGRGGAPMTADPVVALTLRPRIIDAVCSVYDPEIPVNIWELGLIYGIDIDSERRVQVQMTLTAPGCPVRPGTAARGGAQGARRRRRRGRLRRGRVGTAPGPLIACPTPRSCNWGCSDRSGPPGIQH